MEQKRKSYSPLSGIKKDLPFEVPENYFEKLNDSVIDHIRESESEVRSSGPRRVIPLVMLAGAAAIIAGLLLVLPGLFEQREAAALSAEEIASVLEDEIYDLDGYMIESTLTDAEQDENLDQEEYRDEIVQYLLDENIELESIVNEL